MQNNSTTLLGERIAAMLRKVPYRTARAALQIAEALVRERDENKTNEDVIAEQQ